MGHSPKKQSGRSQQKKTQNPTMLGPGDLRLLFDTAPMAIAALDKNNQTVECNQQWRDLDWPSLWAARRDSDGSARRLVHRSFVEALRGKSQSHRITPLFDSDGTQRYARWMMHPWENETGDIIGVLLFVEEVTAEVEANLLAEQRTATLDAVLDNVSEAIIACDAKGHLTFCNRRVADMVGVSHDNAIDLVWQLDFREKDGETKFDCRNLPLNKALKGQNVIRQPLKLRLPDDTLLDLEANAKYISGENGDITGAVVSLSDVSEQRAREQKLRRSEAEARRIAFTDALTGYPNRASLQRTLQQDFSAHCGPGEKMLLVVADIARFKSINAIHGNEVGDKLLAETADRMAGTAGPRAIVGRLSGDEFLVVVPVPQDAPYDVLDRMSAIMNGQQVISGHLLSVQLHAGTALWPDNGEDGNTLLRRADMARRKAKDLSGQTVCHFDPGLEAQAQRQIQIEQDLCGAIQHDDLSVAYQPVIDSQTGQAIGVEALCRWDHPMLGNITPDVFIPAAEQTGDILDLGEWVLRRVMEDLSEHPHLSAAVNVSPSQFIDPHFTQRLKSALIEFDFDPRRLELEVTESLVLEDQEKIQSQIKALQAIGVQLALDDFGTGYSSLAYLQTLKFNKIKIDRSFVMRLGEDREALALVQCMIQMGKSLNMTVVAEGIETEGHALMLRHTGCDFFQGYFFARPMPIVDALAYCQPGRASDQPRAILPAPGAATG